MSSLPVVDRLYPVSPSMLQQGNTVWQPFVAKTLKTNIELAKAGNLDAEQRIVERVGQIRRNLVSISSLTKDLIETVKEAVALLKSNGRRINLNNQDPRYWITSRDGSLLF